MLSRVIMRAISPLKTVGFRTFFVSVTKRRPRPLVKRVILHLGMPKAASTSIQSAFHSAQETKLTPNGIWYRPPNGILTDYLLYEMIASDRFDDVRAYACEKIAAARDVDADTVIFSAERLFTLDTMLERITQLGALFSELAEEVCFCIVVREMKSFMRSYITQMIYNGGVPLHDCRLAEWTAGQVGAIVASGLPVKILSLSQPTNNRNVAESLIATSTGREIALDMGRLNVTPERPIPYALAEGLAARLHALPRQEDVNSVLTDEFRTNFAQSFDDTVRQSRDRGEVHRVLFGLDSLLESKIAEYMDRSLEICPPDLLSYYNNLVGSGRGAPPIHNANHEILDAA